jgi:hypothetical protein
MDGVGSQDQEQKGLSRGVGMRDLEQPRGREPMDVPLRRHPHPTPPK